MKFNHTITQPNGGGNLTVVAETKPEILEVLKHFRVFDTNTAEGCLAFAQALSGETYTYVDTPKKRFWYAREGSLGAAALEPYTDLLARVTGFNGALPDMDLTSKHPLRLSHTNITDTLKIVGGSIVYTGFISSEDWNGKTAAERATEYLADYVMEDLGFRRFEREYIDDGRGGMKRNPKYLHHYKAEPGVGAPWVWKVIFNWWLENHATDGQKAIIAASDALHNKSGLNDKEWEVRKGGGYEATLVGYGGLYVSYDPTKHVTWEEFQKA